MTTLWLVRHGQTDWNQAGRWQGQAAAAPTLNAAGRAQAHALAARLDMGQVAAVYSSDLPRALETARILTAGTGLPVRPDPRLREINLGAWEGMASADIASQYAAELEARRRDPVYTPAPGGECAGDVAERVWAAADDMARAHPGDTVLVVSHGLALATLICRANALGLETVYEQVPGNAEAVVMEWEAE